jgi:hypothetical protein
MSPKLALPSVPLHCPRCPKSSDFIALDCPRFGDRIGDSCPALPWVSQRIGDRIGNAVYRRSRPSQVNASLHAGFIFLQGTTRSQSDPSASDPGEGYTIAEALEKQLGLKLEKQKRIAPVIVTDHIEQKPTDN